MAMIDPSKAAESTEVIPAGIYIATVKELKKRDTNAGNKRINAKFEIIDGDYKSRWIFDGFNLPKANETSTTPHMKRLSKLLLAVGSDKPFDPDDLDDLKDRLVGCVLRIKTKVGEDQNKDPQTQVEFYGFERCTDEELAYYCDSPQQEEPATSAPVAAKPAAAGAQQPKRREARDERDDIPF